MTSGCLLDDITGVNTMLTGFVGMSNDIYIKAKAVV